MKLKHGSKRLRDEYKKAYDRFSDEIFRHCYLRVSDRELANDLVQEAYIRVWEYLSKGKDIDDVRPFLYRTAHNLIIDYVRKKKGKTVVSLEDMIESGHDLEDKNNKDMNAIIDAHEVMSMFNMIEEPYRTVLIMRYVDDMKPSEISEVLGISANSVSVRLNRAVKQLRSVING